VLLVRLVMAVVLAVAPHACPEHVDAEAAALIMAAICDDATPAQHEVVAYLPLPGPAAPAVGRETTVSAAPAGARIFRPPRLVFT
jgi:hypothetical protein